MGEQAEKLRSAQAGLAANLAVSAQTGGLMSQLLEGLGAMAAELRAGASSVTETLQAHARNVGATRASLLDGVAEESLLGALAAAQASLAATTAKQQQMLSKQQQGLAQAGAAARKGVEACAAHLGGLQAAAAIVSSGAADAGAQSAAGRSSFARAQGIAQRGIRGCNAARRTGTRLTLVFRLRAGCLLRHEFPRGAPLSRGYVLLGRGGRARVVWRCGVRVTGITHSTGPSTVGTHLSRCNVCLVRRSMRRD
eukprot:SAG11_NODE_448_length_9392_cov_17.782978_1_plen_252_part_10